MATGTIVDDDEPTLSIQDVSVGEDAGTAIFVVTLDTAGIQTVTVDYATGDGTATAGSDYAATSGTLTIAAGLLKGTITAPILDDTLVEADETFTLTLSDAVNASISEGVATGTIVDDDEPTLSIEDVSVGENAGTAIFVVTLDTAGIQTVSVDYAATDGTATAGSDYAATSGTLTIAAGLLKGTITAPILDDTLVEADETFTLTLGNAANASISEGVATGTIVDDDEPTLSIQDVSVGEDAGTAIFVVTLDTAGIQTVTVDYAATDGTATAGSDYAATSGTLTIAAGLLKGTITAPILDDTLVEADETFTLTLSDAVNASISAGVATGTIVDDDEPGLVGLAKEATGTGIIESGMMRSTFRIHVINLGAGPARRVQVSDDLSEAFPEPTAASVVGAPKVTGASLTLNPGFDGVGDIELLMGSDSLEAGATAVIEFTVEVALNGAVGPFENQAVASHDDGSGKMEEDLSDHGSNPDPDGDGDPGDPGEDDPTPIEFASALIGTVYADLDVDATRDADEPGLAAWRVEVSTSDGAAVAHMITADDGSYAVLTVETGEVAVRFRHPESNAVWREESTTVPMQGLVRLDYGAVPGGRVYDSVSRDDIPGVVIALADEAGTRLADQCLLEGQQMQRTGRDGAYRFDVVHGAGAGCPTASRTYAIEIVELPDSFNAPPSLLVPPAREALSVGICMEDPDPEAPCVVHPESQPPSDTSVATYYLKWVMAVEDGTVVHNHVPLDPVGTVMFDSLVSVSKQATVRSASVGDLVGYNVQVANPSAFTLRDLELVDDIPAGFTLAPGTAALRIRGSHGLPGAADEVEGPLEATTSDPVTFGPIDIPSGATATVSYMMRVTTGASPGQYVNTVKPFLVGRRVGNESSATVEIIGDPIFEKTTVIGKVFDDRNGDGWQDPGEQGIPGVRLASVSGLTVETDAHGRYHLADIDAGDTARGQNFIIKLDSETLPRGAQLNSENPRVIRLTQALMSKVNFGVRLPEPGEKIATEVSNKLVREVRIHRIERIEPVRFESGKSDISPNYLERLRDLLTGYRDKSNLRVRFSGHTDDEPLGPIARTIYGDNQGLSEARALEVAQFVAAELGLPDAMIETVGFAERVPVASNRTRPGMALNRRVETELLYDEYAEEEVFLEQPTLTTETTSEVRYAEETTQFEPARFPSGSAQLPDTQMAMIDRALKRLGDYQILGAKVVGHADSSQVSGSNGNGHDNRVLSQARAESVAGHLLRSLDLRASDLQVNASGDSEPVADNQTAAGRALNRRVEIELTYRRVFETITTRYITFTPVQIAPTVHVNGEGRIWLTEDALAHRPQLDVLALNDVAIDEFGNMQRPVKFAAYNNYALWISEYRLEIYRAWDTDLIRPLASLATTRLDHELAFELMDETLTVKPGEGLAYVLKAVDDRGREDVTRPRLLGTVDARRPEQLREAGSIWGQSNLAKQSIPVRGSRIRVHGEGFQPREVLRVEGEEVPVDGNGRFAAELHVPTGSHEIVVSGVEDGRTWSETLTAEVDENYAFVVGLANVTIGQTRVSDSFEELSAGDDFDESVGVDGRLAFYLKAKVKGKYIITAQLDTTEDELDNLGDNLKRKDPRRVFRQLDPDKYYPVYGDDATTFSDVYSQGPFFLRVDWNRNEVLLGNFTSGLTNTEYMQYNRSLYGAKLTYMSEDETRFGDAKRSLTAFASEAQSAAAHASFRATGGSLYYLRHTDIVVGSEKVWVEVRHRDTGQVMERQAFVEGRDYEVDALQGRIILSKPLSQVMTMRPASIIRTRPLEGDDVFVLVDYEYVPDAFEAEEMVYGARGKAWIGDHFAVGASKIVDGQHGGDFDLQGVDVTVRAGKGTYLSIEAAQSDSLQARAGFDSVDGGLSFQARSDGLSGAATSGDAFAVAGRVNLAEYSETLTGDLRAWWKEREAGFSAGRLDHGFETVEKGMDAVVQAGEKIGVQASYAEREEGPLATSKVGRIQTDVRTGRLTVGGELRHEEISRRGLYGVEIPEGKALLAGVRVGYDLDADRTVYGSVQTGLDESGGYVENDMVAVGIDTQITETTSVTLEGSDGDRGSALSGGFEYNPAGRFGVKLKTGIGSGALTQFSGNYELAEGHELYGSYAMDPDRTFGERNLLTLGQRRDMGNRFGIFTESQFGDDDRYAGVSHTFGLDYKTTHDWILSGLVTISDDETTPTTLERQAFSFGASTQRPSNRFTGRLEYRADEGPAIQVDQYIASSSYTHVVNEDQRWLGRLNISHTNDRLFDLHAARFVEFDIGHAYRPVDNDRWNTLFKYGYFQDLVSAGQEPIRPDQRAHVLSAEALYRVNSDWELGSKLAIKEGRMRAFRDKGDWYESSLVMAVVRARRHVAGEWDALAEYRMLRDRRGGNGRHGALLGVSRDVGENFEVGVGYNFTDFSDDIRDARYDHQGWFIDLIGKF